MIFCQQKPSFRSVEQSIRITKCQGKNDYLKQVKQEKSKTSKPKGKNLEEIEEQLAGEFGITSTGDRGGNDGSNDTSGGTGSSGADNPGGNNEVNPYREGDTQQKKKRKPSKNPIQMQQKYVCTNRNKGTYKFNILPEKTLESGRLVFRVMGEQSNYDVPIKAASTNDPDVTIDHLSANTVYVNSLKKRKALRLISISTIWIIVYWRWNYMKISTSYPYPVLYMNNHDYAGESSFHTSIDVSHSFGEVKISVEFHLKDEVITKLIDEGSCVYLIHVECSTTSFRQAFQTKQKSIEVSIPTEQLRGKIEIHSFIIALNRIENYENQTLNDWFKEIQPITFEKGNLLGIGEAIETTLFEDDSEMLNLPSIVKVSKSYSHEFMEVEMHSNILTISLPEYEYNQYATNANSRLKNTIISAVILPSLVYVFSKLKENREDVEEYTWYQVLVKIFDENNFQIEDVGTDSLSALKKRHRWF